MATARVRSALYKGRQRPTIVTKAKQYSLGKTTNKSYNRQIVQILYHKTLCPVVRSQQAMSESTSFASPIDTQTPLRMYV
jgi:hypothetical protein